MSFSYTPPTLTPINGVRLLISDTQEFKADGTTRAYVFSDEEITMGFSIQQAQFQSSMFYSGAAGQNLPSSPVSYLRVAALLLDALASNKARLASIIQLLDVKLAPEKAAMALRDQAKSYRETDDNAGAFMVIEQCPTMWAFQDRYWAQVQRQIGGGF